MNNLKILTVPNPLLRQKSKPVKVINNQIKNLAGEMIKFLKTGAEGKTAGVGLSAPQIGQLLRIIMVLSKSSRQFLPMINPEIVWHSKRQKLGIPDSKKPLSAGRQAYEGCLSVPNVWAKVKRYSVIKVAYKTLDDQKVVRKLKGFSGVVVQHEIDHLDGILFVDRVLEQKGKLYQIEQSGKGKEEFVEVKI